MLAQLRGKILVALCVSLAVLSFLGLLADPRQVWASLASFRWIELPAIAGLVALAMLARWLKADYALRRLGLGAGVDQKGGALLFLSGALLVVMPQRRGAALKPALLKRINATPRNACMPLVALERLSDLLALLLLGGLSAFLVLPLHPLLAGLLLSGVVGVSALQIYRADGASLTRPADVSGGSGGAQRKEAARSASRLFRRGGLLLPLLLSLGAWLCEALAFACTLWGTGAAPAWQIVPQASLIVVVATLLGRVTAIAAGPGVFEAVCVGLAMLLIPFGAGQAIVAALLFRLMTLWPIVALGVVALVLFERRYGDVQVLPAGPIQPKQALPG